MCGSDPGEKLEGSFIDFFIYLGFSEPEKAAEAASQLLAAREKEANPEQDGRQVVEILAAIEESAACLLDNERALHVFVHTEHLFNDWFGRVSPIRANEAQAAGISFWHQHVVHLGKAGYHIFAQYAAKNLADPTLAYIELAKHYLIDDRYRASVYAWLIPKESQWPAKRSLTMALVNPYYEDKALKYFLDAWNSADRQDKRLIKEADLIIADIRDSPEKNFFLETLTKFLESDPNIRALPVTQNAAMS